MAQLGRLLHFTCRFQHYVVLKIRAGEFIIIAPLLNWPVTNTCVFDQWNRCFRVVPHQSLLTLLAMFADQKLNWIWNYYKLRHRR